MATTTKLVADLTVLLRGMRAHEGSIAARAAQARTPAVATFLDELAAQETVLADRLAQGTADLGAAVPRVLPGWVPSPTSVVGAVAALGQPFGEALVLEAAAVRLLADRAQVASVLAHAVERTEVAETAAEISGFASGYADWLVDTASTLVVDEDAAELVPTVSQRLAGRAKDAAGAPIRLADQAVTRIAQLVP